MRMTLKDFEKYAITYSRKFKLSSGYAYVTDKLTEDLKNVLLQTYNNVSFAQHIYQDTPELVEDVIVLRAM